MYKKTTINLLKPLIVLTLTITVAADNVPSQSLMSKVKINRPSQKDVQKTGLTSEVLNSFPFTMQRSKFLLNGEEVFLNIIGYQPLEPEQDVWGEISDQRIRDDLRRWKTYDSGSDPIVIRVYPGPTGNISSRMPQIFYDGIRDLNFWIIRDIYFSQDFCDPNYPKKGCLAIDSVIGEVSDANALDLIFAWEIGNEFPDNNTTLCWNADDIEQFIENMCNHLKNEISELEQNDVSNWVTWASYPSHDPLFTGGVPIEPNNLDYISYNAYSYDPERIRDHQAGPTTGTPFQGYLAALKERDPNKPLVITETGLPNSNLAVGLNQDRLHPWYPAYRRGRLTQEQVAEGLADRYWDARLLRDDNDPNLVIAGIAAFEWNDEWHKVGYPDSQADDPEEHFGLSKFIDHPYRSGYQLRHKLQQETVRDLYTLNFDENTSIINSVTADSNSLSTGESTTIHAELTGEAIYPVRFRWESSRGYIVGDSNSVEFYPGNVALGPAAITAVAIDANKNVGRGSTTINIEITEPNIVIFTLGTGRASGLVTNVNLEEYKLVVYIETDQMYVQPDTSMTSIWIRSDGYWWTKVHNNHDDSKLICWLVDKDWPVPDVIKKTELPDFIKEVSTINMDPNYYADDDNDLLPDWWKIQYFGDTDPNGRYDDPDNDMANNLEEFLSNMNPNDPNDDDNDGLWDNWERHYFGDITIFDANDDPDNDGLNNAKEIDLQLHPGRTAIDRDLDELPDLWEIRWFGSCDPNANENPDGDCLDNLEEYELGLDPISDEGDLDCNYDVGLSDFCALAQNWLQNCSGPDWCERADLNRNGEADLADLAVILENWLLDI